MTGSDRVGSGLLAGCSADQALLAETTRRFLDDTSPLSTSSERSRVDPAWWQRGANIGWTLLLVGEADGGGSVSGSGLVDATLLAEQFGRVAAGGPLIPCNVVAQTLSTSASTEQRAGPLAALLSGMATAAWVPPSYDDATGRSTLGVRVGDDHDRVTLSGTVDGVEAAGTAEWLLIAADDHRGPTQLLIPAARPGVTIDELESVDLTRRLWRVQLDGVDATDAVVGRRGTAQDDLARQLRTATVLQCAELAGACREVLDFTIEYALNRYSFGRPIASYQALKHRFAEMRLNLETIVAITAAAADAAPTPSAGELASAAKASVSAHALALIQDCVQMHGGIGLTWEHPLHVYLRRAMLHAATFGTIEFHRQRVAVEQIREAG
ncbi:MAG TPA: acyl-CoA dehydrogenase family protein [Ilumatobacter sp.]|nr:acyl-CoA dehydrogenase family protein [Ilumatobacter sp.]